MKRFVSISKGRIMSVELDAEKLAQRAAECNIPDHMVHALVQYIVAGRRVGHFLTAVLSNDLKEAAGRADGTNQHLLWEYVFFLYNYAPQECWGSEENYTRWIENKGLLGLASMAEHEKQKP
jgi:hypothetical protein